jgi:gamma-glutamyl-gamma-aminobutyrate hydrolase PuuD
LSTLKIGITQRVEVVASHGERRDCLDQTFIPLLYGLGLTPVPIPNAPDFVESMVCDLGLEGVIFSGGNDLAHLEGATNTAPERDLTEARLLDLCQELGLPTLGICRGVQMMVHHHGSKLSTVEGHVATRHAFVATADASSFGLSDRDEVNSFHNFGVLEADLGSEWSVLGHAPDGTVEAIAIAKLRRAAILWHPERAPNDPRDHDLLRALFLPSTAATGKS